MINKGYELEKRDVTNEAIKVLNATWLPCSTRAEIAMKIANEYANLASKDLERQDAEYREALKKEQEDGISRERR